MNDREQVTSGSESQREAIGRFLRPVLLWDGAIFVVVGVACALNPAWHSWIDVANGLVLVCVGVMAFNAFASYGGWMQTGSFDYQYAATVDNREAYEHAREFLHERGNAARLIVDSVAISLLPLLASFLLARLA